LYNLNNEEACMADLFLRGDISAAGAGAIHLQPARFRNGPHETQAADKLPHSA
jgi:hypothetical protein